MFFQFSSTVMPEHLIVTSSGEQAKTNAIRVMLSAAAARMFLGMVNESLIKDVQVMCGLWRYVSRVLM